MQIKRLFATPEGWQPQRNLRLANGSLMVPGQPENELLNPPPLTGIELWHTGKNTRQNFSDRLVNEYLKAGIMRLTEDSMLLFSVTPEQGDPVDLRYRVMRVPGSYCLHCGENLNDNGQSDGSASRAHVAEKHAGAAPIPGNPAGYERIHHYECDLDAAQQEAHSFARWDAKRKGRA